jgi:hypothetical protein
VAKWMESHRLLLFAEAAHPGARAVVRVVKVQHLEPYLWFEFVSRVFVFLESRESVRIFDFVFGQSNFHWGTRSSSNPSCIGAYDFLRNTLMHAHCHAQPSLPSTMTRTGNGVGLTSSGPALHERCVLALHRTCIARRLIPS